MPEPITTEHAALPDGPCHTRCTHASEPKPQLSTVSPLDILAAAVAAVSGDDDFDSARVTLAPTSQTPSLGEPVSGPAASTSIDQQYLGYFGKLGFSFRL